MAPFHRTAAFLWAALTLFLSIRLVAAQEPQMGVTYFDNLPGKLFYFEDTSVSTARQPTYSSVFTSTSSLLSITISQTVMST